MSDHEKQKEFEITVRHINSVFPKKVKGSPLVHHWDECQKYIEQARALAKTFQEHSKDPHPIQTLPELGELLKNCVWYLCEVGRHDDALELIHMMIGRVHFLRKDYPAASEVYDMAEEIFKINPGPESQFMAHLIYAFGNLEYAKGNFTVVKELYEKGHKMSHDLGPKHVLTATFDYKLGLVEAQLKNYDEAMNRLQKALVVVEMHKAKGDTARILRRQAIVIRENPQSTPPQVKEADKLMEEAETIRAALPDPGDQDPSLPVDLVYDNLVCGYFRQGKPGAMYPLMRKIDVELGTMSKYHGSSALGRRDLADNSKIDPC